MIKTGSFYSSTHNIGRIDLISFGVVQSTFLLIIGIQLVTVPDVLIVLFNGTVR